MLNGGPETAPEATEDLVIARLNARLRPADRREFYMNPLDEMLQQREWGEVTGAGTQIAENGEIAFCDIEIVLTQPVSQSMLEAIRGCLEAQGAAKGSALFVDRTGEEITFGANEGLAIYLNSTDLPNSVYEDCDFDTVWDEFGKLLGSQGRVQSDWDGPTETALYLYGPSYDTMVGCLQPFLDSYPLCAKARLEQIA